jgi:hypothetical protein
MTHLPYPGAVIIEAMRLHPSVALILERHVPKGGITGCGKHIPAGTIIGINAWACSTTLRCSGSRVLCSRALAGEYAEKLKGMEQSFFAFSAGSRTCVGRIYLSLRCTRLSRSCCEILLCGCISRMRNGRRRMLGLYSKRSLYVTSRRESRFHTNPLFLLIIMWRSELSDSLTCCPNL